MAEVNSISSKLQILVWEEMEYLLDVCRVTNASYVHTHTGLAGAGAGSGAGCNVMKCSLSHVVRSGTNAGAGSDIRKCNRR